MVSCVEHPSAIILVMPPDTLQLAAGLFIAISLDYSILLI
jgi:hypothetical protein